MSLQQPTQPKLYANGFGRRRAEKEGGAKLDSKLQSGKSIPNRSNSSGIGGKVGAYESPSRDRLVYLSSCLIGHPVEVHLKNGSIYSGTCYTTNVEKEFAIILKMARLMKDVSFRGQKTESLSKAPSKTFIIPGKDVVQVIAKDVPVTMDGMTHELHHKKQQEIMIDSFISQSRHVEAERELAPWVPDEDDPQCPELENIFDGPWKSRGWDQFETNEMLFGVKSTFDEELYTTKLERGPKTRELEKEATRIAREIEGEDTKDLHLAEERGVHFHEHFDIDEETRFSSVYRGTGVDDSGYEETEDIILDSRNSETFGDTPASCTNKYGDLSHGEFNDGARVLSSSSLDEAECSQSTTGVDSNQSGSYEHSRRLASEFPPKTLSTSESKTRGQENLHDEHGANECHKEFVEEQIIQRAHDAPLSTCDGSQFSLKKDAFDKGGLSSNSTNYAPSPTIPSKRNEKTVSSGERSESAPSVKVVGEVQSAHSRGRPGSAASSNSDCVGAASVSNGPGSGLSPSSSMGSLTSEKSTLNPYAKEFKLNPNAKSFLPSQAPVRPPSPMSDGSFYFPPNVHALPHMHGMPMGIGVGPSFTSHQPVIYNPQVASLQSQQAYFHPGPQYGQQMLVGHPRQVLYMPGYQPEMPFKGRDF